MRSLVGSNHIVGIFSPAHIPQVCQSSKQVMRAGLEPAT